MTSLPIPTVPNPLEHLEARYKSGELSTAEYKDVLRTLYKTAPNVFEAADIRNRYLKLGRAERLS